MCRSGRLMTYLCAALVSAHVATSRPHQCALDEYAKALLGQYYAAETAARAVEPVAIAYDNEDAGRHAPRPGRSNDRTDDRNGLLTQVPAVDGYFGYAKHDAGGQGPSAANTEDAAAAASPSHQQQQQQQLAGNETASAAMMEKLAAYYEQLKSQHETLARQQLQHQLYEQQRRRQQEYMLVQQQIQQQYYQQQQHALRMLEQLRKNPEFAGQLAAFIEHRRAQAAANNGTAAVPAVQPVPNADASEPSNGQQQWPYGTGDNRPKIERDASSDDDCDRQRAAAEADDADDADDSSRVDDDQTPPAPVFEKSFNDSE